LFLSGRFKTNLFLNELKEVVVVDLINEILRKSGGLVYSGVFKPFNEIDIKNTLFLNTELQFTIK